MLCLTEIAFIKKFYAFNSTACHSFSENEEPQKTNGEYVCDFFKCALLALFLFAFAEIGRGMNRYYELFLWHKSFEEIQQEALIVFVNDQSTKRKVSLTQKFIMPFFVWRLFFA